MVFLQEIGVPSFPNEILLFYFGILTRQHVLFFPTVFIIAVSADITGTLLVYYLFYYAKPLLKKFIPSWLPVPYKKISQLTKNIHNSGSSLLFIGRLTPFLRGYISVASGLLNISAKKYIPILICSAVLWTGGWVTVGYLCMPFLSIDKLFNNYTSLGIISLTIILFLYLISLLNKQNFNPQIK